MLSRRYLGLMAVSCFLSAGPALAQDPPRFGDVPYVPFSGQVIVRMQVDNKPSTQLARINLRPSFDAAWRTSRPALNQAIQKLLGGMRISDGLSVYDVSANLAHSISLEAKSTGVGSLIRLTARGNSVYFKSTTPDMDLGLFSIGIWRELDPKIRFEFDVAAEVYLEVGANGSASARVVSVNVSNVHTRGANVTGWIIHAAADVLRFFGGANARSAIANVVDREVNGRMGKEVSKLRVDVGKKLPTLPIKPTYVLVGMDRNDLIFTFTASTKPYTPPVIK